MTKQNKPQQDETYYKAYLEHKTISRRGLFAGLVSGAKKSHAESEAPVLKRPYARPPYAQEEVIFVRLCQGFEDKRNTKASVSQSTNHTHETKCQSCIDACPEHIIEMQPHGPSLNLDYNHCTSCGECVTACPTNALDLLAPKDNQLRPQFAKHCNNNTSSYCSTCTDACPQNALTHQDDGLPKLETHSCDGCGQCATSCYIQAISMHLVQ